MIKYINPLFKLLEHNLQDIALSSHPVCIHHSFKYLPDIFICFTCFTLRTGVKSRLQFSLEVLLKILGKIMF